MLGIEFEFDCGFIFSLIRLTSKSTIKLKLIT